MQTSNIKQVRTWELSRRSMDIIDPVDSIEMRKRLLNFVLSAAESTARECYLEMWDIIRNRKRVGNISKLSPATQATFGAAALDPRITIEKIETVLGQPFVGPKYLRGIK